MSAFATARRFASISERISPSCRDRILVVRWRLQDLLTGSSDLKLYEIAKRDHWRLFVNLDLHAKLYCFDNDCAAGSANLTENGLGGISPPANREMLVRTTDTARVADWFRTLLKSSTELDDRLFNAVSAAVEDCYEARSGLEPFIANYEVELEGLLRPTMETNLYTYDLFWLSGPALLLGDSDRVSVGRDADHDLSLLGLKNVQDPSLIADRFRQSRAFRWLSEVVTEETYFGELSAKLHDALCDDPAPYRKDVKILVANLLNWVSWFGGDYFEVDQPNVSQRLRRLA